MLPNRNTPHITPQICKTFCNPKGPASGNLTVLFLEDGKYVDKLRENLPLLGANTRMFKI